MRFWDASAIVPLCVRQPPSPTMRRLATDDGGITVWWGTPVECVSAVVRLRRAGTLAQFDETPALAALTALAGGWNEVLATDEVRNRAERLLRVHALRAADALQLAAALVWSDGRPQGRALVTLDQRLAEAARLEGFAILPDNG